MSVLAEFKIRNDRGQSNLELTVTEESMIITTWIGGQQGSLVIDRSEAIDIMNFLKKEYEL